MEIVIKLESSNDDDSEITGPPDDCYDAGVLIDRHAPSMRFASLSQLPSPAETQELAPSASSATELLKTTASVKTSVSTGMETPLDLSQGQSRSPSSSTNFRPIIATVLPHHPPPTCPLDRILLNLLSSRQ
jgi:hypothetical protein